METNYCSKCGAKINEGVRFCSECGEKVLEIIKKSNHCSNCGYKSNSEEKYCPDCGAVLGEKIIDNSIKKVIEDNGKIDDEQIETQSQNSVHSKKRNDEMDKIKKGGCLRKIGKILLWFLVFLIIGTIILYNLGDVDNSSRNEIDIKNNVIQGDNSDSKNEVGTANETEISTSNSLIEPNSLKNVTNQMEAIFSKGDTVQLKILLTDTSLKTYKGVYTLIQPHMKEYSNAFKNRKLIRLTEIYSLYTFEDSEGNKYNVEFAFNGRGTWKLVRF